LRGVESYDVHHGKKTVVWVTGRRAIAVAATDEVPPTAAALPA